MPLCNTNVESLPHELLSSVLLHTEDAWTICRAATVSQSFQSCVADDALWKNFLSCRYGDSAPLSPKLSSLPLSKDSPSPMKTAFRERWRQARRGLLAVPFPVQTPAAIRCVMSNPNQQVCCSAWRNTARPPSAGEAEFKRGFASLASSLASGELSAGDVSDWLLSGAATEPFRVLAAIALLTGVELEGPCLPNVLRPSLDVALDRLRSAKPEPAVLAVKIALKWTTWSSTRDCRGFRARDGITHRIAHRVARHSACHTRQTCHVLTRVWHSRRAHRSAPGHLTSVQTGEPTG